MTARTTFCGLSCVLKNLILEFIVHYLEKKMAESSLMKALVKEEPVASYELKEIPIPEIESDEVLFKVEKVAICGSDIALYQWNEVAKVIATIPFIPGLPIHFQFTKATSNVRNFVLRARGYRDCYQSWGQCARN